MASCTVDKSITFTAASGMPISELRQVFGEEFPGARVEVVCRLEGHWSSKEEAKTELATCIEKIWAAFREQF